MTDWTASPRGYDLSHWDGDIDWPALAATRPAFVVLKATQGMGVDPKFDINRRGAIDNGIPWLWYSWIDIHDVDAVIKHAISVVGDPKIPAALDCEEKGITSSIVEAWIDALARNPWAYYGPYPPMLVTPKIRRCLRWFPQYPGSPTADPRLPAWDGNSATPDWSKEWFVWQWSETARVAGVPTAVDANRLSCSWETFEAWYRTGVLPSVAAAVVDGLVASPLTLITRTLRLNSSGADVAIWQKFIGADADGAFGPATWRATVAWQTAHAIVGDGVVGPITLAATKGI